MVRVALVAVVLMASACSSTFYAENDEEVRIKFGGGGLIGSKVKTYHQIAKTGKPVVIDGQVISADAFLAFSLPNACYTEKAVFSPHAASYLGLIPARKETEWLTQTLPDPLEAWFRGNVAYHDWIGFATVEYDQLLAIWPEGACRTDTVVADAGRHEEPGPVASQTLY